MSDLSSFESSIKERVNHWLSGYYDEDTKKEIRRLIKENPKELIDSFYTEISFGTGGLRGIMGVGPNRMNKYTVSRATQGLANYLLLQYPASQQLSVIIGFDNRNNSKSFAQISAQVLAANGITVYIFKNLRPTPFISFSCRYKKCSAAIMITASHNPAEYNGYKVYWNDGAQVVPPHDKGIMDEVHKIVENRQVLFASIEDPLIHIIDDELDEPYLKAISQLQNRKDENLEFGNQLKICYSSLHGTGITLVPKALKSFGFTNINIVEEQAVIDGNFPTVRSPNPESGDALKLGLKKMSETDSDILIETDPDADRMGAIVNHNGNPFILNGNHIAVIFTHYLCETLTNQRRMPQNGVFVTTIVSTELMHQIASFYHKPCFEVLIGFKYIGEKIHQWETMKGVYTFIFGAEESLGYLIGSICRDKDAVSASCIMCEIALFMKRQGKTLVDLLFDIYAKYGVFKENSISINLPPGKESADKIKKAMDHLRTNLKTEFCQEPVKYIEDYSKSIRFSPDGKIQEPLYLPKSNTLIYRLATNEKLIIRPSGTEPKIKIYAFTKSNHPDLSIQEQLAKCEERISCLLKAAKEDLIT